MYGGDLEWQTTRQAARNNARYGKTLTGFLYNIDFASLQSAFTIKFQRGYQPPAFGSVNALSIAFKLTSERQNLDCDFAIQFRIKSEINLAHPARAERRADFVTAETSARLNRHAHLLAF
jgi:hypothetical protein